MRWVLRWASYSLIALLLLVVLATLILRFASPWAVRHADFFSWLLSHQLGVPVKLQGTRIAWHGTTATIEVGELAIQPAVGQPAVLSAHRVRLVADGWHLLQSRHWVLDGLAWQQAMAVLSFDKANALQLGYPDHPLHFNLTATGHHFVLKRSPVTQHSMLSLYHTDLHLIRSAHRQTDLVIAKLSMSASQKHRFQLRWRLAGQTQWQQADATWQAAFHDEHIQIHFPVKNWDISPLLAVLTKINHHYQSSVISWDSDWRREHNVWSGGWRDLQIHLVWGENKELTVADATGVIVDKNPRWAIEMLWPTIRLNKQQLPKQVTEMTIDRQADNTRLQFQLPDLPLQPWSEFLLPGLDEKLAQLLNQLQLHGMIKTPQLYWQWGDSEIIRFTADLDQVSWSATKTIPGFSNLSAKWAYDVLQKKAQVELAIQDGQFNWPAMFEAAWNGIKAKGLINLQQNQNSWQLSFEGFDYHDADVTMQAQGSVRFDAQFQQPYFDWSAIFSVDNIAHVKNYLPYKMAQHTRQWLRRGLQKGIVHQASMSWVGPINGFPYLHNEGQWHLYAPVTKLSLFYKPQWPWIEEAVGKFYMNNTAVAFSASTASLSGNVITKATGRIPNVLNPILYVRGQSHTLLQNLQHFINIAPFPWKKNLQVLKLSGPIDADIRLQADVNVKNGPVDLQGNMQLQGATVELPAQAITIHDIRGMMQFTDQGIVGRELSIRVLDGPAVATIETKRQADDSTLLTLAVNGQLSMAGLNKQMPFELLHYFHGLSAYQAHLVYGAKDPAKNQFSLQTTMQGIQVDLPEPLNKMAQNPLPVDFRVSLTDNQPTDFTLRYGSLVQAIIRLQKQGLHTVFDCGAVVFGSELPPLPVHEGLQLSGVLQRVDGKLWQPVLKPFFQSNTGVDSEGLQHGVTWSSIDLLVKQLKWGANDFGMVSLFAAFNKQGADIKFNSKYGTGTGFFSHDAQNNYLLNLKNFDWKPVFTQEFKANATKEGKTINWSQLPNIELDCENCRYGKTDFGSVGLTFKSIKDDRFQLKANWAYQGVYLTSTTQWGGNLPLGFIGRVATNDLSDFVRKFSDKQYVDRGEGTITLNLSWPKSPFDFSLAAVSGDLIVNFANLRFINLPKKMQTGLGVAKLINILSVENSLPFINFATQGFYVHKLAFTGIMQSGTLSTSDLTIHSPVMNVDANGNLNLINDTINMQLSLQPQVTGSVPIIAAIAGGPLVGVLAYALNQVVEPLIGKAVALHYIVSGNLANPTVKKIDKTIESKQSKAA